MIWKKCTQLLQGLLQGLLIVLFCCGPLSTAQATTTVTDPAPAAVPPVNGRVLFVLSSQKFHGNSTLPAVISFGEVVHAFDTFAAAGYAVDFVSPAGGAVPIDPAMLGDKLKLRLQDSHLMTGLTQTQTPDQIDASRYRAVYYVGGSNAMYQVPDDVGLQRISRQIYEQHNGVVSAVCHGTAGIAKLRLSNGDYLVSGKRVTGYPEDYEDQSAAYFPHLPFRMRQTLQAHGALFKAPDPEQPYIEVDGRLVTGQNYPSAPLVARAVVQILQQQQTTAKN